MVTPLLFTSWPEQSLNQILFDAFEAFKTVCIEVDSSISNWINTQLSEVDLDSTFTYHNIKGESHSKNFGEVLSHLFNHQTHHRAQVSTLSSESGDWRNRFTII